MSSLATQTILTPEEYIASERKATLKSDYLIGCELRLQDIYRHLPEVIE